MVRSEAVQRMALADFSVRQSSSDAVTRELDSLRISSMGDGLMTAR